jgi:DNA-binding CsgD family transcriptional regulator
VPHRASPFRETINAAWLAALGTAAQEIAAEDFPTHLLHLFGALIRHDMALVVRYVEEAPPDFLVCEGLAPHLVELYRAGLWRYDPFYGFWQDHREGGLASLREILPPPARRGYYHRVFQRRQAKIEDELGLFLPAEATGSLGLFLERSTGSFSPEEMRLAAAVAPLMAGLYRAHRLVAAAAAVPSPRQAPREVDGRALDHLARQAVEQSPVPLTRRERDIVALILSGQPSLRIAGRLGISRGTVKNHRRRIYRKLQIASERELFVTFLGQRGLH